MQPEKTLNFWALFQKVRASRLGSFLPVILALIAIWLYFGLSAPVFLSPRNFYNLFMQSAVVGILAVGLTVVLLLGEIDLSAAATAGTSAALMAVLLMAGVSGPVACLAAMGLGAVLGVGQGVLVAYVGIPSFVVTLAGLLGFQGLMLKILGVNGAINVQDPMVRGLTTVTLSPLLGSVLGAVAVLVYTAMTLTRQAKRAKRGLELELPLALWTQIGFFALAVLLSIATLNAYKGVPILIVMLIALTAFLGWFCGSTPFGRSIFAVGGNAESARRVGMNIKLIRVSAFGIVGVIAAIGGIVGASRYGSVSFNAFAGGSPLLLQAIGAAVIGGTSLFGGRGSVWNAILGALVIGSLGNGLDLTGASAADKLMFSGAILLLAVAIDALSRAGSSGQR
jgi:D-xylose transport system permease protein